jgi:hypothetical protein
MQNEFEGLKEGDNIFEQYGGFSSVRLHLTKVTRVTKTQIIVNQTKYRIDGSKIGGKWSSGCLRPYTLENIHHYEIQEKRAALGNLWSSVEQNLKPQYIPEDKLDRVSELLQQLKKEVVG